MVILLAGAAMFSPIPALGTFLCGGDDACLRVIYSGHLNGVLAPCG